MEITVNYLAVLFAAVANMALGFLWYGPLFGKVWMKLKGYSKEDLKKEQKQMGKYYAISFVVALITGYMLSHVMALSTAFYGYPAIQTGLTSGLSMWLGFVMPVQVTATIFGDKKWKLLSIDTGYQLVGLLVMGVVIGFLG